jgi:hypothetical protein
MINHVTDTKKNSFDLLNNYYGGTANETDKKHAKEYSPINPRFRNLYKGHRNSHFRSDFQF